MASQCGRTQGLGPCAVDFGGAEDLEKFAVRSDHPIQEGECVRVRERRGGASKLGLSVSVDEAGGRLSNNVMSVSSQRPRSTPLGHLAPRLGLRWSAHLSDDEVATRDCILASPEKTCRFEASIHSVSLCKRMKVCLCLLELMAVAASIRGRCGSEQRLKLAYPISVSRAMASVVSLDADLSL